MAPVSPIRTTEANIMEDLISIVPAELLDRARLNETEFVFAHPDVLDVIRIATEHAVAILGIEVFEVKDGLLAQDYSGYEFPSGDDWRDFVLVNNRAAMEFVRSHPAGEDHGYILTSSSEREFRQLI